MIYCTKYFDEVDSTNNLAKQLAFEGCNEGTVVIAKTQTAGKGRLGRTWDSKNEHGIWMSVVLRPTGSLKSIQVITTAAAVAVSSAIKEITGIDAGIKWPNDLLVGGKKICGILTEAVSTASEFQFVILGIGINVNQDLQDFPADLRYTATSLKILSNRKVIDKNALASQVLLELSSVYNRIEQDDTADIVKLWENKLVAG